MAETRCGERVGRLAALAQGPCAGTRSGSGDERLVRV